jgi:two-component system sensor histidine kinase PilS (NtrC family)
MPFSGDLDNWLPWVIKIRFVLISFVFAIDYAIRMLAPNPSSFTSIRNLAIAVILWYILNLFFLIYNQLSQDHLLQAHLQIFSDLAVITAIVHVTGDLESNYSSLYLVSIIMTSTLLPRARAFLVAAVSFVLMGALLELAYLPSLYPGLVWRYPIFGSLATASPLSVDLRTLQVKICGSLLGFFAVAYLSSHLAESLRKTGAELRDKSGQVANLQAINENIIQSMHSGLLSTDLKGTITELNPAGAAILGYKPVDLKGKRLNTILGDLPRWGTAEPEPSVPQIRQEVIYPHPQGEQRILGISESPLIVPDAGVVGYVYNFQDLTEEKLREAEYRAKDRMASLGRLAAGIAHEIRNPLASIAGSVKLLENIANLDEDQAKLTGIVSRESERLNKLVSDFLLYSREQRFEFRDVDVVNLLEETLMLVEHHPLFGGRVRVERKLPHDAVMACADADKIRQVFWNICDNALKAMGQGGTLTAEIEDPSDQDVRVILSDTGIGFSRAQMEKLFEPFQPGFADGTGLGLAMVYQIIEAHRGWIHVNSTPGKGSRFLIVLPRVQPKASSDTLRPAGSAAVIR